MTGPTKILTVSYGTFSCTLEGFDDPLGSMREMAEYFRDLAADDRYFGAEPPTPDVEMLQRIAEKEVQRRVEARVTETGVALVAAQPAAPKAPAAPEAEAEAETAEDVPHAAVPDVDEPEAGTGPLAYDDDYLMSDEPEDALSVDPEMHVDAPGPAETVAEKLRRIRAVVSQNVDRDKSSLVREQAPNSEDPQLRERALSETIQQIQDGLSDDEEAHAAEVADTTLTMDPAAEDEPADLPDEDEDWSFDADFLAASDEEDEPPEEERAESKRERSVSEMIGNVAERVAQDAPEAEAPKPRVTTRTLSPEPEADVGRLLNETDSKLNDNETVRRRRVISQMRAAVAATKADRMVSKDFSREAEEEAEQNLYREDLSEAVQGDAPYDAEQRHPAPLVLVSSQRIDSQPPSDGTAAAAFAAQVGAKELPELMEAAAAFAIFSEGLPSFTRPEIMQMVTRMDPSLQLSREESLRSFGQLLRDGTFRKLERGQFTIDQATKYHPEQRASGV
ncbi:MAG: hypothetical protein AAFR73_04235 [Pseudomonadota bacterium]